MKMITREEFPCWYELSWEKKPPQIRLRIHQDQVAAWKVIPPQAPLVQDLLKELRFTSFQGSLLNGNFGFNGALKARGKTGDFFEFLAPMPKVQVKLKTPCNYCKGSGKDEFSIEEKCFSCGGIGKEYTFRWKTAYAISASLSILLMRLEFPNEEKDTSASFPQLLTVRTIVRKEMHGGSLGGEYSRSLVRWLNSFALYTKIPEMVEAMEIAYGHMFGRNDLGYFEASIGGENGWLNVSCPGDACGLNPSYRDINAGEGYEFSCHNVDNPGQQLTLLVGLAALHDRARKELTTS